MALIYIGGTPSRSVPEYWGGEIKWASARDIASCTSRYIRETQETINALGLEKSAAKMLGRDTILITARGTVGAMCMLAEPMAFNQTCYGLVAMRNTDPAYLYYALKASLSDIATISYGTVFNTITMSSFDALKIPQPPLPEQRAIAHILGTLDDKIELNRRMNQTLEEMAQALFKSWFVDFEPFREQGMQDSPLGEIPVGWRVGKLSEIADFIKGVSYRSSDLQESDTALVTLKSIARGGGYQPEGLKPYIGEYDSQQELHPGDVVVAHTDLTQKAEVLGRAARVQAHPKVRTMVASLDLVIVRPIGEKASNEFLYGLLSREEFREYAYSYANGTTVLHLSTKALPEYRCVLPTPDVIDSFTKLVRPLYAVFDNNEIQNRTLASIRDTLLPKLLSGEIRVKDAEKFVEAKL
jgi:type I restriction enzyme S subunit